MAEPLIITGHLLLMDTQIQLHLYVLSEAKIFCAAKEEAPAGVSSGLMVLVKIIYIFSIAFIS